MASTGLPSSVVGCGKESPAKPVRTCIGCRVRACSSDLLRVVMMSGRIHPDPGGSAAGRGAYLHPIVECYEAAMSRRAWSRALRVTGPSNSTAVRDAITAVGVVNN